jgi:hypothetical protein
MPKNSHPRQSSTPQPKRAKEKVTATMRETAVAAGIGINQAYAAAKRGEIPTIRIGKRLLVPKAFLRQLEGG